MDSRQSKRIDIMLYSWDYGCPLDLGLIVEGKLWFIDLGDSDGPSGCIKVEHGDL